MVEQVACAPGSTRTRTWAAFSSASTGRGGTGGNTRFVIKGRRGKDIKAYSNSPNENEVLFRAGTNMRVLKEPYLERGVWVIRVEEAD